MKAIIVRQTFHDVPVLDADEARAVAGICPSCGRWHAARQARGRRVVSGGTEWRMVRCDNPRVGRRV